MHRNLATAFLLTAVSGSGPCDSDTSDGGASTSATAEPNIDPTLLLTALTSAQEGTLCDWEAAELGGYGTTTQCPTGDDIAVPSSQAECVAASGVASTCTAIVGDIFSCYSALAASPCTSTELNAPACQPLLGCRQ